MTAQSVAKYFAGAGGKYLGLVDTPAGSHQSEIGKASLFGAFLGSEERRTRSGNGFAADFLWLADDVEETLRLSRAVSWYDTRKGKAHRGPEWRLYYGRDNPVMAMASEGDLCIVARRPDDSLLILVSPAASSIARQLAALFGIPLPDLAGESASLALLETALDSQTKRILEELDIPVEADRTGFLETMLKTFGGFPATRDFSAFARSTAGDVDPATDPDHALLAWFEWEDRLFRELEAHVVGRDVEDFAPVGGRIDVDGLSRFFLGVHNRRKSRAGHAFAHHIREVFECNDILFEEEVRTENAKRLDFMMPNGVLYREGAVPKDLLTALGAKTSCKDRWRQVLSEARHIPYKHLITLETRITGNQLDEMAAENLRLVIPQGRHWAFEGADRGNDPLSVAGFLAVLRERQERIRRDRPSELARSLAILSGRKAGK